MTRIDPPPRGRALLAGLTEAGRLVDDRSSLREAIGQSLHAPPPAKAPPSITAAEQRRRQALAHPHLARGERLAAAGLWADAAAACRRAVQADPDSAKGWYALGRACLLSGQPEAAAAALLRAVDLTPDNADAHLAIGTAFDAQGQLLPAIAAFRRALELAPHALEAASRLATLLAAHDQQAEAADILLRTADRAPPGAAVHVARGSAHGLRREPEAAEAELRLALARAPDDALTWRLLGQVLADQGRIPESREAAARALRLDATQTSAFHDLVRAGRVTEADRVLMDHMAKLVDDPRMTPRRLMHLHFALGKAHDDLDEPAAAIARFDAANAIRARLFPFDRAAWTRRIDRIIATFTPDFVRAHAAAGVADDRPLLILGMPRSGTTLTEQILSSHPQIAGGGELSFWTSEAHRWEAPPADVPGTVARLAAGYRAALDEVSADARRVTDKNPYNFLAFGTVRLAFANARIIHTRRHPVDTCLSLYTTFIASRTDYAASRADLVFFYREYLRLMDHWQAVLPAARFMELDYERLVADREAETRRLVAFAGLAWDPVCLAPEENRRVVHTASVYQARRPVYASSVERWRRYEPWLGELRELLDEVPA